MNITNTKGKFSLLSVLQNPMSDEHNISVPGNFVAFHPRNSLSVIKYFVIIPNVKPCPHL